MASLLFKTFRSTFVSEVLADSLRAGAASRFCLRLKVDGAIETRPERNGGAFWKDGRVAVRIIQSLCFLDLG